MFLYLAGGSTFSYLSVCVLSVHILYKHDGGKLAFLHFLLCPRVMVNLFSQFLS